LDGGDIVAGINYEILTIQSARDACPKAVSEEVTVSVCSHEYLSVTDRVPVCHEANIDNVT
jgi:hypothetical protein